MSKKIFPGMRLQMGAWDYFSIKVKFKDLESTFNFAASLDDKKSSLDALVQRNLNENRATKPMREFLQNQKERFYSAIVVANLEDERINSWIPLVLDEDDCPEGIVPSERELGYLEISSKDKFYILDGQHRAASIISILNPESDFLKVDDKEEGEEEIKRKKKKLPDLPESFDKEAFKNEEIIVTVLNKIVQDDKLASRSYRRLFSSLNRYAKPTDTTTNIITGEDDTFYILTRRLIEEFEPFNLEGEKVALANPNILMLNSFNGGERQFTTLQALANMNQELLRTNLFPKLNKKLGPAAEVRMFRQEDEELDMWFEELKSIWEAIFKVFPEFNGDRSNMRSHGAKKNSKQSDHAFLWPKVQTDIFVKIIRSLLDKYEGILSHEEAIKKLSDLNITDFGDAPWINLLLIEQEEEGKYKIRQDDLTNVVKEISQLLRYLLNLDDLEPSEIKQLKKTLLSYTQGLNDNEKESFWKKCEEKKLVN